MQPSDASARLAVHAHQAFHVPKSWGQRDRVDAQQVWSAPERARPASEAAQLVPGPGPTVGGTISDGSAAVAAIITLGYMGLAQVEEVAETEAVVLLMVSHAHLTRRSFSVSHQHLSFHPRASLPSPDLVLTSGVLLQPG